MKKTIFITLIIGLFFTFSVSAQIKPPANQNELTNAQKMLPFAMGMSLAVLSERYDENYHEVIVSIQKQIRYYSVELKPVVDLKKDDSVSTRRLMVEIALDRVRAKTSVPDRWQMLVGSYFGDIFVEIKKAEDKNQKINEHEVKFAIDIISRMANNPPKDIPWNVVDKLKDFGKLTEVNDITTDANVKLLTNKVVNILSVISESK